MNLLQLLGGALVLCTLGGGACWLADGLIEAHVAPRARPYVAGAAILTLALIAALTGGALILRHGAAL
jgi:hypothetical protein